MDQWECVQRPVYSRLQRYLFLGDSWKTHLIYFLAHYDKGRIICAPVSSLGVFFSRLLINWPRRSKSLVANSVSRTRARLSRLGRHISNKLCGPRAICAPTRLAQSFGARHSLHFRALNFCCWNSPLSWEIPI